MGSGLKRLREGARRFQQEMFPNYRELFETLATGQVPQTLLITWLTRGLCRTY